MPYSFEQFDLENMDQIRRKIEEKYGDDLYKILGPYWAIRNDKNSEYAVLEYKRQESLKILPDLNNPDLSINISNEFDCTVIGFNNAFESGIKQIVNEYLRSKKIT